MRFTARLVLPLAVATATALLLTCLAPAASADAAFDQVVEKAKREQDARLRDIALKLGEKAMKSEAGQRSFLGAVERLVAARRKATQTQGSALSHYLYGRIEFKMWEYEGGKNVQRKERAIRGMNAALGRDPRFWHATYALAYIHFTSGDVARGEAYLEQLLRTHGDHAEVIALQASVLESRGRWKELQAVAEKLLRANSQNLAAWQLLAKAYMGQKLWGKAQQAVERMITQVRKTPELSKQPGLLLDLEVWRVQCLANRKKHAEAERDMRALINRHRTNVGLRMTLVDLYMMRGGVEPAIAVVEQIVATPTYARSVLHLGRLSDLYLRAEKPAKAEAVLRRAKSVCLAGDEKARRLLPGILANLALALEEQEKSAGVVETLGELDRVQALPPQLLDLLQINLARQAAEARGAEVVLPLMQRRGAVLRRMLPFLKDAAKRANMEKLIARIDEIVRRIEAGEDVDAPAAPTEGEGWPRNKLGELLEDVKSKDVAKRREALRQFYELNLSFVDPIVYEHYDPRVEPDAECRLWVVKILARFRVDDAQPEIVRTACRYVGLALEDPDQGVRTAAADGLRSIASPAGIIYLMPYLEHMDLSSGAATATGRKLHENEYNAARKALAALTGRNDIPVTAEHEWIPLAQAAAHRRAWLDWYDSDAAVEARLSALKDLDQVNDVGPRWPLRYLLTDLIKARRPEDLPPDQRVGWSKRVTPAPIFLRSYQLLRSHVLTYKAKSPEEFKTSWFPTFPIYEPQDITVANLAAIRQALLDWWRVVKKK